MSVVAILVLGILIPITYFLIKQYLWSRKVAKLIENISGPPALPLIGNSLMFIGTKDLADMYRRIKNILDEYGGGEGGMVRVWIGTKLIIILSEPKHVEVLLASKLADDKDDLYQILGIVGNGIFVRNGQDWRDLRKPANKMFSSKAVESNLEVFHKKSLKFCKAVNAILEYEDKFDVRGPAMSYSLDVLSVNLFGHESNELENNKHDVSHIADDIEDLMLPMMVKPHYIYFQQLVKFTSRGRLLIERGRRLWNLCHEMLSTRKEERKHCKDRGNESATPYFSDVILNLSEKHRLSYDDTGRLVADFVSAGVDTTGVTIAYTLLMLAMHPEYQQAAYQEQLDLLGGDPEISPSWDHLTNMTYLNRVIKEVLRLFPPASILRKTIGDIKIDEYTIPAGSSILVSLFGLQRNKRYWKYPDVFYPDHFLPEEVAKRPKLCTIPFSWGPRACPGALHGTVAIKMVISLALRKFVFTTDLKYESLEFKYGFISTLKGGHMVSAAPRGHENVNYCIL